MKTAFVTGSSRGIGRAIAIRLAQDGYKVLVHGAGNIAKATETKQIIEQNGGVAEVIISDLTDLNSTRELCEKIKLILPKFTYIEAPVGEDPDKRNYIVSNEKLESLGWKPFYSLDDGIRELTNAYEIIKNNKYSNI